MVLTEVITPTKRPAEKPLELPLFESHSGTTPPVVPVIITVSCALIPAPGTQLPPPTIDDNCACEPG